MNALLICFAGACSASMSNLFFRKSAERSKNPAADYYLLFFYAVAFAIAMLLYFIGSNAPFDWVVFAVGCAVGALNMGMMQLTFRALLSGPSGLTFTFQNASGVFPGLLLFFIFGPVYGFEITLFQLLGMGVIVFGLYLGSEKNEQGQPVSFAWLKYALGCFFVQILALTLIHWRCLLFGNMASEHALIPCNLNESADSWFLPGQFGMAFLLQLGLILVQNKKLKSLSVVHYGCLGGVTNAATSLSLMVATKIALPLEKGLIFPCFAAGVMILCNLWARWLYGERFNIAANACCCAGIFLTVY